MRLELPLKSGAADRCGVRDERRQRPVCLQDRCRSMIRLIQETEERVRSDAEARSALIGSSEDVPDDHGLLEHGVDELNDDDPGKCEGAGFYWNTQPVQIDRHCPQEDVVEP